MHTDVLNRFSYVRLFVILWTVAHQSPLSMGFSREEYWSGLSCPPPGGLPNPRIKAEYLMCPASAGGFFTASAIWETQQYNSSLYTLQHIHLNIRHYTVDPFDHVVLSLFCFPSSNHQSALCICVLLLFCSVVHLFHNPHMSEIIWHLSFSV